MKTKLVICAVVVSISVGALPAWALDVSIGPTAWFAWWKPAFEDIYAAYGDPGVVEQDFQLGPAPMYGAALSLAFSKEWSWSSVFVYGNEYRAEVNKTYTNGFRVTGAMRIEKTDLDSTVNYSLSRTVKVFGGVKYQGYSFKDNSTTYYPGSSAVYKTDSTHVYSWSTGPGLGVGFTIPVSESVFILLNASGLYMYASLKAPGGNIQAYDCWGGNAGISLAYYVSSMSTTIALGGRYQFITYAFKDNSSDLSRAGSHQFGGPNANTQENRFLDNKSDQFYGITLSAVYSFEI